MRDSCEARLRDFRLEAMTTQNGHRSEGQRITVMFVINGLGTGGAERSLAEMLPGLVDGGVRPVVAVLAPRTEGVQEEVLSRGYDVRFLNEGNDRRSGHGSLPFALWGWTRALRGEVAVDPPDIVHTTHFESDLVGRLAFGRTTTPLLTSLVNTADDAIRRDDPNMRPIKLMMARRVDGWTARRYGTHFHAITHAVKRDAAAAMRISPDRITVIERGRDPIRLGAPDPARRARARRDLGLAPDDEVVVNLGRREYQKGQRYLIEAIAAMAPSRKSLRLLIAGRDCHASAELSTLVTRLGLENHVRFLGHRSDVPEILSAADVFAFPSLYEGLGGALIEAMALGLPVVASDLEAVREVVEAGNNAALVPVRTPDAIARAIDGILDSRPMAMSFGRRSRQIFEERFTLERSVKSMTALYRSLATRRAEEETYA